MGKYDHLPDVPADAPYSKCDYYDAKSLGLDLDDWNDYVEYYELGKNEEYE
ncbi:hypothetical protein [Desulfosporosinus sp. FKA]|uniref:hypothetical protein n=1 Tax=Desulfosporosinus sp. FKA TaxID=1969834 RepID=UPI0015552EA2|nr:hypothetical protein [Desulfosporosinus sp. FKA]